MTVSAIPVLLRRHVSTLLIALGAILLVYVGFQYGEMYWSQRKLQRAWLQQQSEQARTGRAEAAALRDDGLTRLSIPRIDFAAVVVEGVGHRDLLLGPGHLTDSPAPGEPGNSVISGHRDTFFRHIYELEKGDEILVQRKGKTFHYEVTGKHIVQPTDISVLQPSKDPRLTLITCYPTYYIGPAPERLVVTSKLVEGNAMKGDAAPQVERASQKAIAR